MNESERPVSPKWDANVRRVEIYLICITDGHAYLLDLFCREFGAHELIQFGKFLVWILLQLFEVDDVHVWMIAALPGFSQVGPKWSKGHCVQI